MSHIPRAPRRDRRRGAWLADEYAALDFETTGLDPIRDRVVSFGVVPIIGGRIVFGDRVYQEVTPGAPLTARSVVIHGVRPADVADAPGIDDVRGRLSAPLDRRIILAWAAHVEATFLAQVFGGGPPGWRRRCIDVRELARLVDRIEEGASREGGYALGAVADRYGVPVERPHHALDDALTTAQLFLLFAHRLAARGYSTPARLVRAGRGRRGPTR